MALLRSGTRIYGNAIVDTVLTVSGNTPATNSTSGAIVVTGGIGAGGNIFSAGNVVVGKDISANNAIFSGNVIINGNIMYSNVSTLNIKDPLIEQGGQVDGTPLIADDGKDRGQILHYFNTSAVDAFMGWDNSNAEFALASNVSVNNNVVTFNQYGNLRANFYIGDGSQLSNITGANVTGYVSDASHATISNTANVAYSVSGSNVTGQVANALIAGTVYTNSQPNITSVGTLTGLSVAGLTSLGPVSNVSIAGGSANYVLQTDGNGTLSWTAQTGGSGGNTALPSVTVDDFVADGLTNSYQLSVTPASKDLIFVNIDGVFQVRSSFDLFGNAISFGSTPIANSVIEVSTFVVGAGGGSGSNVDLTNVAGNIIPSANITYDLGTPTKRWKDLYLSGNTIHLGDKTFSVTDVLPFSLTIDPEVLTINVDATAAGDAIDWLWTWQQSTLPYARATITNSQQLSVPLYKEGTYVVNNFAANVIHGNMTQTHHGYFKWIDGAGLDNLIGWANTYTHTTVSHPSINGGANTTVQQYSFTVPSSLTVPTLVAPNVTYAVSTANSAFHIGEMAGEGDNVTIGPVRRGGTYTFNFDSTVVGHQFYLTTDNGTGFIANSFVGEYTTGVTGSRNDGSTGKTSMVWHVANDAPDTLFYQSSVDPTMRGSIIVKDLAVETNINGNYVVYFQHMHEGHKTPIELKPIPSMVNQMCLVYDQGQNRFVPQDMATYVDNTPSFKNKIREVAGTATLVAPSGVSLVPTVLVVESASYLPLVGNKDGDIAFDKYTDTLYVWGNNTWNSTKPTTVAASAIVGTVASATTATTSVTVTSNAQPNITSVGTLTGLTVSGNIIPSANVTYNLGNATNRFKDLYLSGTTIDLAGATIKTDATTGAITFVPQPTIANPNPVGLVVTASGTLATVASANGVVTTSNIANAVSNASSSSTLTGLVATGNVNLTSASNVSLGAVANVHITGGANGQVLKTDGTGNLSWGSASSTMSYVKEYYWRGNLIENTGSLRHYIHTAATLTGIYAYLATAGLTQSTAVIKKNGTAINTITIPANTTNINQSGLSISLVAGDYLTVDITQSSSATDLYINFVYQG